MIPVLDWYLVYQAQKDEIGKVNSRNMDSECWVEIIAAKNFVKCTKNNIISNNNKKKLSLNKYLKTQKYSWVIVFFTGQTTQLYHTKAFEVV